MLRSTLAEMSNYTRCLLTPCHDPDLKCGHCAVLQLKGIPNNLELCKAIAGSEAFAAGRTTTGFLNDFTFAPHAAEIVIPGMNTTVQVQPQFTCTAYISTCYDQPLAKVSLMSTCTARGHLPG